MAPNPEEFIIILRLLVFSVLCALSDADERFIHANISSEAFENNNGCDGPLRQCKAQKLISTTTFKLGFMIGYVIFTVSIITLFIYYRVPRSHVKEAKELVLAASLLNNKNNRKIADDRDNESEVSTMKLIQIHLLEAMVLRMSFAQLSKATDDFRVDNIIGFGNIGTMYKAILPNGRLVAVKKIHGFQLISEEFEFELKILASFRHVNCVPLLGFCIESASRHLVYKYMSNGSLHYWLQPAQEGAKILEWPLRIKIAVGLARGLAWLHHICSIRVVHLNISSKCVLLDQNFEPKLSNFGKAMIMNPNDIGLNRPRGFSINKEFWELEFMKKDVFDFGIVFLELIAGEDLSGENKSKERFTRNILQKWKSQISANKSQIQQGLDSEILECLLGVAFNCIDPIAKRRPRMLEVYRKLRTIGEAYGVVDVFEIE